MVMGSEAEPKHADEDTLEFEVIPPVPHVERLRKRGRGPYYIAPDSAERIPDSIWQRIDLDDLAVATKRANDALRSELTEAELADPNPPLPLGNYMPKGARDLVRRIGGPVAEKVLNELSVTDKPTEIHATEPIE